MEVELKDKKKIMENVIIKNNILQKQKIDKFTSR